MCFGSSTQTNKTTGNTTTTATLPKWFEDQAKTNLSLANTIASRPYVPYNFARVAPFSRDQNRAMQLLRDKPRTPRLIDDIPGAPGAAGGAGGMADYMNPFDDFVIQRGLHNLRRQTDMAQQANNVSAHQAGAFGDARHGVSQAEIERGAGDTMSDFLASNLQRSFDTAMGLRGEDIDRGERDFYSFIDSLFKSGAQQQDLGQRNADLAYSDFQNQRDYPVDMLNLLTAVLTGTPHPTSSTSKTTSKTETPGPSLAGQILGAVGSLGSLFI